jgi:hypothetical protein
MVEVRGYSKFAWALPFRYPAATALAVMLAGSLASTAGAQVPPTSQIPEKIEPPLSPSPKDGNDHQFKRQDGVIQPPSNIDPEMENKPRDKGARTPVIPPPGGDEKAKPK